MGGMALSLLPATRLFAGQNSQIYAVELPEAHRHVRHGMLSRRPAGQQIAGLRGLTHFQKDIFHADGVTDSQHDLVNLSFELEGEAIHLGVRENKAFISTGEHTREVGITTGYGIPVFQNRIFEAEFIRLEQYDQLRAPENAREVFFLPLQGSASINGFEAREQFAVLTQGIHHFRIRTTGVDLLRVIRKKPTA